MEIRPLVLNPALNITKILDVSDLPKLQDFFDREKNIGFDVETEPKRDFFWRKTRLLQFGNVKEQYVIDLLSICKGDANLLFDCQGYYGMNVDKSPELRVVIEFLRKVLESADWLKLGVNLGFEYTTMYWNFGVRPYGFYDCMSVEKVIYAGFHSLKDYGFYSMAEMFERYFGKVVDKSLQESFTLDGKLSEAQYEYAALDTRLPFGIRSAQKLIITGITPDICKNEYERKLLKEFDKLLLGDNLEETCQVENDAIGSFQEMHIHGERIDKDGWNAWLDGVVDKRISAIKELDKHLIPVVGDKTNITDEMILAAEIKWKSLKNVTIEELELKKFIKKDPTRSVELTILQTEREALKEKYKKEHSELKKKRTKIKNLMPKCEGEALINYGSPKQLLNALKEIKGLGKLEDTNDDTLEQLEGIPVVKPLQKFREYDKILSTYGRAWASTWVTKPCQDEGWLHPGDGRIHHVYNQQDAETGRSSSDSPNGQNLPPDPRVFYVVDDPDEDAPEGWVYVTADMSGAELRIIAELADDPIWIGAFARGEDVHSLGAELLHPDDWPLFALPDCAYYMVGISGDPQRHKCDCPQHKELRKGNKSTNFLLAYGGGPSKLAREIKRTFAYAKDLMGKHKNKFPRIWEYLERSGKQSGATRKSFDMFGRRRIFPHPTDERARSKAKEDFAEDLEYPLEIQKKNKEDFFNRYGRKANKAESWILCNREPNAAEVIKAKKSLYWGVERQGKNHAIQGTNASIAKLAMGAGYDKDGKPYLFHVLPKFKAKLKKFVHDELVVMCPKRYGEEVAALIGDAFRRAAATKMKKVIMEFDYEISIHWEKH